MSIDWDLLSDDMQLAVSRAALERAATTLAGHAELLAAEIEAGHLADRGGPEALRLFAAVMRRQGSDVMDSVGDTAGHG